jgi:hypothetical protein
LAIILGSLVVMTAILALRAGTRTTLEVGTDAELKMALERATGGETIVLRPGGYGLQYPSKAQRLSGHRPRSRPKHRAGRRVQHASRCRCQDGRGQHPDHQHDDLTPDDERDAVRINRGSHHIEIAEVTIQGGRHCVDINAHPYGPATWPHDITVRDSDLSRSLGDVVQITGVAGSPSGTTSSTTLGKGPMIMSMASRPSAPRI